MTKLPHINKMKFGILDARYMNTVATRTNEFEDMKMSLQQLVGMDKNRGNKGFLAFISKAEAIAQSKSSNKDIAWKYDWFRCDFSALPRFLGAYEATGEPDVEGLYTEINYKFPDEGDPDGEGYNQTTSIEMRKAIDPNENPFQDSEYQCYAYNLAELTNIMTDPIICGVDTDSEDYPEDYQLREASGFVWLTTIRDAFEGNLHFIFDRMGIHDGECD